MRDPPDFRPGTHLIPRVPPKFRWDPWDPPAPNAGKIGKKWHSPCLDDLHSPQGPKEVSIIHHPDCSACRDSRHLASATRTQAAVPVTFQTTYMFADSTKYRSPCRRSAQILQYTIHTKTSKTDEGWDELHCCSQRALFRIHHNLAHVAQRKWQKIWLFLTTNPSERRSMSCCKLFKS